MKNTNLYDYFDPDEYTQTLASYEHSNASNHLVFNKHTLTWAHILGNFNKNFIFISSNSQLYLVDQHAISEK